MSLKRFLNRTLMLIEQALYESRLVFRSEDKSACALQVTQLEQRILMSASPAAAVVEAAATAAASSLADAPTTTQETGELSEEQFLDVIVDQILPQANTSSSTTADQPTDQEALVAQPTVEQTLELVFLDSSIDNLQQMTEDLLQTAAADPSTRLEVIVLDSSRDGIAQMTSALLTHDSIDGIHIVSHGTSGQIQLGSTVLSLDNLNTYRTAIGAWQHSMSDDADILIYGCDVAESADGQELLKQLSDLTSADVAASDDLTGHADLGGDWILEYTVGDVSTDVAFGDVAQASWHSTLDIATGLAGHWQLDDGSGTTADDATANNNDGNVNGTATWTSGEIGGAFEFDPSNGEDYIEIPNSATLENVQEGDYTLASWFRPDSTPPGSGSDADAHYGVMIKTGWHTGTYYGNDNRFRFDHVLDGNTAIGVVSSNIFAPGQFYHVAGVVDRAAGTLRLYVDGALEGTTNFTPNAAAREYGTETWKLGAANPGGAGFNWDADGAIDDARIYNRALTASDVAELESFSVANSVPTTTDATVTTDENVTYTFTTADFNYSDADGDALDHVQITSLESVGSLELSGVAVTTNQIISATDVAAGNLEFVPLDSANGSAYDGFAFRVHDGTEYSVETSSVSVLTTAFDTDAEGFIYADDAFGTSNPTWASGTYDAAGGFSGGGLKVTLGGGATGAPTSGGWSNTFNLSEETEITVSLRHRMWMADEYEAGEYGELILEVNGTRYGNDTNTSLVHIEGNGNGQGDDDTGWVQKDFTIMLAAGNHTLTLGAYNNASTEVAESVEAYFDVVNITYGVYNTLTIDVTANNLAPYFTSLPSAEPETVGSLAGATSVSSGDFDNDGDVDLVSTNNAGELRWHENDGTGNFAASVLITSANDFTSVATYDLEGDGDIDIVAMNDDPADAANSVFVLTNQFIGSGSVTFATQSFEGAVGGESDGGQDLAIGDVDGDGRADIAGIFYRSIGDSEIVVFEQNAVGAWTKSYSDAVSNGHGIELVDLDGDTDLDIVAGDFQTREVYFYENDGNATAGFNKQIIHDEVTSQIFDLTVGDFDADGDSDIAFLTWGVTDVLVMLENDGAANPGFTRTEIATLAGLPYHIAAEDTNADGTLDLIVSDQNADTITVYENDGTAQFTTNVIDGQTNSPVWAEAADIDGDGQNDLIFASRDSNFVGAHINQGDGNVSVRRTHSCQCV